MRIAVLWKRRYMSQDVILDRYARLYELPHGLARLGHEVLGICLSYHAIPPVRREDPVDGNGSLVWQGYDSGPFRIAGLGRYLRDAEAELRRFRPTLLLGGSDAIHVVLTRFLARRLAIPYVIDLYDNFESFGLSRLPGIRFLYRQALRQASAISAVSVPLSEHVHDLAPDVPVITLESTINPHQFRPADRQSARQSLDLPQDGRLMGVCGGLDLDRGIDRVYRAFLNLAESDRDLHLVLAGTPDPAALPPSHPRLHLLGRIPHANMPQFYNALDLALVPMLDTPFGRYAFPQKLYEIMGCHTPILAARVGAMARTLAGFSQCLYDPEDSCELQMRMNRQLNSPEFPVVEIPGWQDQAVKLEKMIRAVKPEG